MYDLWDKSLKYHAFFSGNKGVLTVVHFGLFLLDLHKAIALLKSDRHVAAEIG